MAHSEDIDEGEPTLCTPEELQSNNRTAPYTDRL